jgi:D-glycero-D-manno-heptose 1,7-bisphosphate phosphatase
MTESVSISRTLFLDRDGVINRRLIKRYVRNWDEFEFLPGVLEAIPLLNQHFNRTVIITNQRGISLGLMTTEALELIHKELLRQIEKKGGRIDKIYYCAKKYDDIPNCRKPEPFMALEAQKDFPEINFKHSVMIGDQPGDIEFGNNLGMQTVWIPNDPGMKWVERSVKPDQVFPGLIEYARSLS